MLEEHIERARESFKNQQRKVPLLVIRLFDNAHIIIGALGLVNALMCLGVGLYSYSVDGMGSLFARAGLMLTARSGGNDSRLSHTIHAFPTLFVPFCAVSSRGPSMTQGLSLKRSLKHPFQKQGLLSHR